MFKNLLTVLFVSIFSTFAYAQNKSVYSDLTPKNCKTVSVDQGIAGNYIGKCKGVGGYDLEYYLDDERNSLGVVFPSKQVTDLNFWSYFRGFSELGTKAEWRMSKNKPVALIVRLNVSDQEDETKKTSYLIVSKIDEKTACVTDVVKPIKNQNAEAQKLADKALSKKCMPDFVDEGNSETSAGIDDLSGKDFDTVLQNPDIKNRLEKLLGDENYKSFLEYFETSKPFEKDGNFLFSSGCMIRACTRLESAIAIDLKNNTIHAAIYNEVEDTKYFNENSSKTPESIINWANRLEKNKDTENQTEAVLVDEFRYQNSEDLMARFDNYTVQLQNQPNASGYIVINGDKKSRTKVEKEIKEYVKLRRLDVNRFVYKDGDGDSKVSIRLWIVPEGAELPDAKNNNTEENAEKPMKKEALAALIVELKEVVSKNSPDKNEAKLVAKRWDKRRDLAGKAKSEVIELLYEDVKAVIKDSGTQYQIYSIFSFYKNIPDK